METYDLLFELGTEEIPAKFMSPTLAQIKRLTEESFETARISHGEVKTYGTPRRLVLIVESVAAQQADLTEEVKGPSVKAAYDSEGNPTKAATGFAKGQGVEVSSLKVRSLPTGGDYVWAVRKEQGKQSAEVIPELLVGVITGLSFPKPQRWGDHDFKFARPIRWIVALFGDSVLPIEIAGVKSGRISRGHRFLGSDSVAINDPSEYFGLLAEAYVMVDQSERKNEIWRQVTELASEHGGKVEPDEGLLDEVANILEWPTALYGEVPAEYSHLPKPVITTPMKDHQRYFPVVKSDGSLLPMFITVRNGDERGIENVRAGNERVLNARLADAKFFYDEDLRTPLCERIDDLKRIVYQEKLGSVYDRVERIVSLTEYLSKELSLTTAESEAAARAALLSKADLVTHMVYEFPELQGIMGEDYALKTGESAAVAKAISEHYMPRNANDDLPESLVGIAVALADKIDAVAGAFAIGMQPTGSADPYGIRRQALGICNILLNKSLALDLDALTATALRLVRKYAKVDVNAEQASVDVKDFFLQRFRNLLLDRDFKYDIVDAVICHSPVDLVDALRRIEALSKFRGQERFNALITVRNRASNLAKKGVADEIDPRVFDNEYEKSLYTVFLDVKRKACEALAKKEYLEALNDISMINGPLEAFFNGVMVMSEDDAIRENRLALLKAIASLADSIGDLGRLVEDN